MASAVAAVAHEGQAGARCRKRAGATRTLGSREDPKRGNELFERDTCTIVHAYRDVMTFTVHVHALLTLHETWGVGHTLRRSWRDVHGHPAAPATTHFAHPLHSEKPGARAPRSSRSTAARSGQAGGPEPMSALGAPIPWWKTSLCFLERLRRATALASAESRFRTSWRPGSRNRR